MNVKQNLFVAFALLMLLPLTAGAKPRAKADMKKTAARAINLQTTLNSNKCPCKQRSPKCRTVTRVKAYKSLFHIWIYPRRICRYLDR